MKFLAGCAVLVTGMLLYSAGDTILARHAQKQSSQADSTPK